MSGHSHAGSYVDLLRRPAVARTFVSALVGRLAYGVLPLSLLFTVQHATGSFATAATAMALNGLAALSMPLKSRAIDRHGQRVVVPLVTAAMVAALLMAVALAHQQLAAATPWLAAAFVVGLASPPLGPSMRAQWRALVPVETRGTAYSLDAICEEVLYLLGPLATAAVIAVAPAYIGLLICCALLTVGASGLAFSPAADVTVTARRNNHLAGPLRHRPFLKLLLVMGAMGAVTATMYTAVAARALAIGYPSFAGLAEAGIAVGSVGGGFLWGRRASAWSPGGSLAALLGFLGAAVLTASVLNAFWLFAVALSLGGLAISPVYVLAYQLSDALVEDAEVTEASTWVNTATNAGIAAGAASSGLLVSEAGGRAPTWVGGLLALLFSVALGLSRRRAMTTKDPQG